MVGISRLLQLTLSVAAVNAFYPWFPDKCDDCGLGSKRGVDSLQPPALKGVTLGLLKRVPPPDEGASARSARVAIIAAQLAAKYAQPGAPLASRTEPKTEPKLRARTNTYSVVAPATPTGKNTAGVYQDGTDYSYFIQAQMGSSKKAMFMLLDSGAGTSWVMGPDCKTEACLMHNTFGTPDSTTLKMSSDPFQINYGSGNVRGYVGRDAIRIGDIETQMLVGIANETSKDFVQFPFDGILGLARGKKGTTDNFMAVISESKLVPSNLFAVSLSRRTEVTNAGSITFGGIDPTKYVGDITYTTVANIPGSWAIPMEDMGYGNQPAGIWQRNAYIDTGTSFAFGPQEDVSALHRVIPGAQSADGVTYTVPCDSNKEITITFSGVVYKVSIKDWLSRTGNGLCLSNFYGIEVVKNSWLVGDVFLKNVYSVFDSDNSRIGFANKPVAPEVTTASTPTSTVLKVETTMVDGAVTTITIAPSAPSPVSPAVGLSGQNGAAGTAVPESSGGSTSTSASPGEQVGSNKFVSIMCVVAVIVMMA